MGLIKSYGNYVLQQKHKLTNQGTVFERDYGTVEGIGDSFNSEQLIYRQGTFVYNINNEIVTTKLYNNDGWLKTENNDFWCQENLSQVVTPSNSLEIILKQDLHKLKDFAYYGSCAELVRSSIVDIINNFPGELYVLSNTILTDENDDEILLENDVLNIIDNPFNIDIHTPISLLSVEEQEDIKYFLANYSKYVFKQSDGLSQNIESVHFEEIKNANCIMDFIVKIVITTLNTICTIYVYRDKDDNVIYVSPSKQGMFRIQPKEQYYNNFMSNLDCFQKTLLNVNSKPLYSAIFEVMEENEYGYRTFYRKFVFPLAEGGYNLDIVSDNYINYINSLSDYATLYDEIYCNNLYHNMTHESIKNFDWSDMLNRNNETKDDYVENGQKIEKLLFLCGRELDEIKYYIDNIKNVNTITYNDANNIPDYFLTDTLNIEGWDVKNIFPFIQTNGIWKDNLMLKVKAYGNVKYNSCANIIKHPYGYFSGYWGDNCEQTRLSIDNQDNYMVDNKGYLREKITQYINEKEYSMQELNNSFMKYLKLNSRAIFQKKGTIEAIESLLSLFGLRSKRWFDSLEKGTHKRLIDESKITYDYEIIEHVAITNPLNEINTITNNLTNIPKTNNLIDFINSTKTLAYNTNEYKNSIYVPYQGLPIRFYEMEDGKRVLYPYFSYNIPIDGKPYYQMNGGWLYNNKRGFIDTNTHISVVENVKELLNIREDVLYDGVIYYVKNIKGYYVCVNDEIYDIIEDLTNRYFEIPIYNGTIKIGSQQWYGSIETYSNEVIENINNEGDISYSETKNIVTIDLTKYKDGTLLKIFIKNDNTIFIKQDERVLINYAIFRDGLMEIEENSMIPNSKKTQYFVLEEKQWRNVLGFWGWNQLLNDDNRYLTIKNLKRDYNGNNPHTNAFKYDNGIEYVKYFKQLFKYAIEHDAFNTKCYSSIKEYMSSLNYIETEVGFINLIKEEECEETINLYDDKKIHGFCNYYTPNQISGGTKITSTPKYFYEFNLQENANPNSYYNFYETPQYDFLNNDVILNQAKYSNQTCLDQIINVKNVTLVFYYKYEEMNTYEDQTKYFEEIILHYLAQILPSNVILNVKFKIKNVSNDSDDNEEDNNTNIVIKNTLYTNGAINNTTILMEGVVNGQKLILN